MAVSFDFAHAEPGEQNWALSVTCLYQVHTDPSYQVNRFDEDMNRLVAIYTVDGHGCLDLSSKSVSLTSDTLILVHGSDIRHYGTDLNPRGGAMWHFWWIEFYLTDTLSKQSEEFFMPDRLFEIFETPGCTLCEQALEALQNGRPQLASSLILGQLASWLSFWESGQEQQRSGAFRQAVRLLKENHGALSIQEMADRLSLSERTLRNLFYRYAGCSPSAYRQKWRLMVAAEWLALTDLGISEISDQLGYSSVFVFSRAFRRHFGVSPTKYRSGSTLTDGGQRPE